MRSMIETPSHWYPAKNRWFDMPWMGPGQLTGTGIDPMSGREAILGAFSGQTLLKETFAGSGLTVDMQNHTVIYYDSVAPKCSGNFGPPVQAESLGSVVPGRSDGGQGSRRDADARAVADPRGLDFMDVFRPAVEDTQGPTHDPKSEAGKAKVLDLRVLQFDIIVKDSLASPQTGWVFMTFVYDKDAPGRGTWDKLVPLGAMWGNDPKFANEPGGTDPNGGPLQETWINPAAPQYAKATLGWGGRLSGPIDVAERHNVLLTNGQNVPVHRASSCLSCHGTAQFPFIANLYPSPNKTFPPEGQTFPMYVPGSDMWAHWFQNRAGISSAKSEQGHGRAGLRHADHVRAQRVRRCGWQRRLRPGPCRRPLIRPRTGSAQFTSEPVPKACSTRSTASSPSCSPIWWVRPTSWRSTAPRPSATCCDSITTSAQRRREARTARSPTISAMG